MNIIFLGSTSFAKSILESIWKNPVLKITLVITPLDNKLDRKNNIIINQVALFAKEHNITLLQTSNVNNHIQDINNAKPDILFTCAFGQFLNKEITDSFFVINLHPSLLPKLRGGAPINWAIASRLDQTGITLLKTNRYMDQGEILFQESIKITEADDFYTLEKKLIELSLLNINNWLSLISQEKYKLTPQNDSEATFGLNITKNDLIIDWSCSIEIIVSKIKGFKNIGMKSVINKFNMKILEAVIVHKEAISSNETFGKILEISKTSFLVQGSDGVINLTKFVIQGKNIYDNLSFYNGNKNIKVGDCFEN